MMHCQGCIDKGVLCVLTMHASLNNEAIAMKMKQATTSKTKVNIANAIAHFTHFLGQNSGKANWVQQVEKVC